MLISGYTDPIWKELKLWDTDRRPLWHRALLSRAANTPKPTGFAKLGPVWTKAVASKGGKASAESRRKRGPAGPGVCGRCRRPLRSTVSAICGCPGNRTRPMRVVSQ